MPQENSMKRMFTHKDSIKKIIFSNYLPLSLALNSSSEQFSPNWERFTSTPLNSALSHFRQRADGAIWTFLDKHTFLPLRVIYLLSMRSMWGNFLYFLGISCKTIKRSFFGRHIKTNSVPVSTRSAPKNEKRARSLILSFDWFRISYK